MAEFHGIRITSRFQDITGKKFNRLSVKKFSHKGKRGMYWLCICDCGQEVVVSRKDLKPNGTKSCGCFKMEVALTRHVTHGQSSRRKRTAEYRSWASMIQRCTNEVHSDYSRYGGAGVTVCERWRNSFEAFFADMGKKPSAKHSIDRFPNHAGNYEPGNCRWATQGEQMRNTRRTHNITFNGRTMCLTDWAKEIGVRQAAVSYRLKKWGIERALTTIGSTLNKASK